MAEPNFSQILKSQNAPEAITLLYKLISSKPLFKDATYSLEQAYTFYGYTTAMFSKLSGAPLIGSPITGKYATVLQLHIDTDPQSDIYQRCKKLLASMEKKFDRHIFRNNYNLNSYSEKYNSIKITKPVLEGQDYTVSEERPWYDDVADIIERYDDTISQEIEWVYNEQGQKCKNPLLYEECIHHTYGPEQVHIILSFPWKFPLKWCVEELFLTENNIKYIMSFFE